MRGGPGTPYQYYPTTGQGAGPSYQQQPTEEGGSGIAGLSSYGTFTEQGAESVRPLMDDAVATVRPFTKELV